MRDIRLKALEVFWQKPTPTWGGDLSHLNFDDIHYYMKAADRQGKTWDDVPAEIKNTFDKLGIPEAERKFLAGVGAQYESEVVYHSLREDLQKKGVIFVDTDTARPRTSRPGPKQYFGTIIPIQDNKFAALEHGGLVRRARSSTSRRASRSTSRSRPTSGSTPRTWASSSGR